MAARRPLLRHLQPHPEGDPVTIEQTFRPDPVPSSVHWPELVAMCERRGIPALRMDRHGNPHIVRSLAQLRGEWEAE
jgi:hypothetical protein